MNAHADPIDLKGKKIVIMISVFQRGGCERQAYLLARELRHHHGLDVEVWALKYGGEYAKSFEAVGIPTHVLEFRDPVSDCLCCGAHTPKWRRILKWVQRIAQVAWQIRERRVDILLPFTTWPNVVSGVAYRLAGVELCIWGERHAGGERMPTPERIAIKKFRRFVANSTAGVDFLATEMRVPREKITFVPNGVEFPRIDPNGADWRARLSLTPGQLLVVKVANVTGFKDHATLLRAWKIVQDSWTGVERPVLALAGRVNPDEIYDKCRKIVLEGGLEPTVRFLGSISDVPVLLEACDMAAFSSPNEGMPNGVMECMVAGKAVVASDLPGVRDVLGENAGEVVYPTGDHVRMAELLLGLLRDKEKRDAIGAANQARIKAEFSVERMAERHLNVIRQCLQEGRQGSTSQSPVADEPRAA